MLISKFTDGARQVAAVSAQGVLHIVSRNLNHLVNFQREAGLNAVKPFQG